MRGDQNVGVHGFVKPTFLQQCGIGIDRCCIHPFLGLLLVIEEEGDLHVFTTFGTVPKDDGQRLNPRVFAVTLDQFVEDGFRIVPLPSIKEA